MISITGSAFLGVRLALSIGWWFSVAVTQLLYIEPGLGWVTAFG